MHSWSLCRHRIARGALPDSACTLHAAALGCGQWAKKAELSARSTIACET